MEQSLGFLIFSNEIDSRYCTYHSNTSGFLNTT